MEPWDSVVAQVVDTPICRRQVREGDLLGASCVFAALAGLSAGNREYLGIRIRRLDQSLNDFVEAVFGLLQREFLKVLAIHALAPPVRTRGKRIGADGPDDLDPERARVA